ncbi:regulatory protein, LacI [Catenovulum agarivorans DS-2]|uniref:Regulatory protein, LacI n=1 Tax=Catenovulum agarivorans DS-2 TaxID=1328313 RepID=W7QF92_9ALTE|nr:polysaccharide deacetylase family protein [Catenovulum agarivorans]EWH11569.1 regulatory protein, LacI [Catenovulum agarivorans DS-2]
MIKLIQRRCWILVGLIALQFSKLSYASIEAKLLDNSFVILQYHHVANDTPAVTSVTDEQFIQHLDLIEQLDMNVVDLADAIDKVRSGEPLPDKSVAITFDDGYKNIANQALPELVKRGWPATVFVNPGLLTQSPSYYLTWPELKHWSKQKITIANHGWLHDYWVRENAQNNHQWQQKIKQSITDTEQAIIQHIGYSRKLVAYPYGEYDTWLQNWLREQKLIAFGQQSGGVAGFSDFTALPRFPASGIYANEKTLTTKLLSRVLPVDYTQLPSPIVSTDNNPPSLSFKLLFDKTNQLNCFIGGKAEMVMEKLADNRFQIKANQSLDKGRSRYNCTMQSKEAGRFYWLSQSWLIED